MPSFLNKPYATYFKNLLGMNQTSNTGVDATTRNVQDGAGNNTAVSLSDDVLSIQPVNDNTAGTMLVKNKGGSNILAVDTSNSKVKVGASQTAANTLYAYFGQSNLTHSAEVADQHYAIPFLNAYQVVSDIAIFAMGTSTTSSFNDTNPATSLTIATTGSEIMNTYWYVPDNITVDAVHWFAGADAATGDDTAAHLMAYDLDKGNGSTSGDLSSGVVVADGSTVTNAGYEQIHYQSLTMQNADVDAGQVILFAFASDTVNSDYTVSAIIKYHIR